MTSNSSLWELLESDHTDRKMERTITRTIWNFSQFFLKNIFTVIFTVIEGMLWETQQYSAFGDLNSGETKSIHKILFLPQ